MLFASSSLFTLLMVLLVATKTTYASFYCTEHGDFKEQQATIGYCMRYITSADRHIPGAAEHLEGRGMIMAYAKQLAPTLYTCAGVVILRQPFQRIYCCHPQLKSSNGQDTTFLMNRLKLISSCYSRDAQN